MIAVSVTWASQDFQGTIKQQGQLGMFYSSTPLKVGEWIGHHAKVHVARGPDLLKQLSIKRYGLEKQHAEIAQTGHHGVVTAVKQRHAHPSAILKRKPIAVRAPHGIDIVDGSFVHICI